MFDSTGNPVSASTMARYSKHLEMGAMLGMLGIAGIGTHSHSDVVL
jgi:hypothetical protein